MILLLLIPLIDIPIYCHNTKQSSVNEQHFTIIIATIKNGEGATS